MRPSFLHIEAVDVGAFSFCAAMSAVLYFHGDHGLSEWGLPMLLAVFALTWAGSAFRRYGASTGLYPRLLRTRYELELAVFVWGTLQRCGGEHTYFLSLLRAAQRAACGTHLVARIGPILQAHDSEDPAQRALVGAELRAALDDAPAGSTERLPVLKGWVLPSECLVPVSAVSALAGAIAAPVSPPGGPVNVLQIPILFALAIASLRLVRIVLLKRREVATARAFRTILVSDQPSTTTLRLVAAELYSTIGHLVQIVIVGDGQNQSLWVMTDGTWLIDTDRLGLAEALTIFGKRADLIVLESENKDLAAQIRDSTTLPDSRRLALSRDGSVPSGYSWVEPMALRQWPSPRADRDEGFDLHRASVLPGRSLWEDRMFQFRLFLALGFALLDGGAMLAAVVSRSDRRRVLQPDRPTAPVVRIEIDAADAVRTGTQSQAESSKA